MPRITLPDDQWADIREDIKKAPRKLTKAVTEAQTAMATVPSFSAIRQAATDAAEGVEAETVAGELGKHMATEDIPVVMPLLEKMHEAQVLALVTAWSFDLPIIAESLDEIPGDAFEVLVAEVEKRSGDKETKADLLDPTPLPEGLNA